MEPDFYQALGVSRGASAPEIKDAYRRLVRQHHPDANPERREASEELMKRVLEAYATLGDEAKRTRYYNDLKLRAFEKSQQGGERHVIHPPYAGVQVPDSLMGKVRLVLGESSGNFAAQLGLSETDLCTFEARDAMPQASLQMRTFGTFVERAAQKLEADRRMTEAQDLRSAYNRKKANRNFRR